MEIHISYYQVWERIDLVIFFFFFLYIYEFLVCFTDYLLYGNKDQRPIPNVWRGS